MKLRERTSTLVLTQRDVSLLYDLARFGALRRGQVQSIHFPDCALRRCNRRLSALVNARLITGFPLTPAGMDFASMSLSPFVQRAYRLTAAGADIAAPLLGWEVTEFKRTLRAGTPGYLAHNLSIADVYVTLSNAERTSSCLRLCRFQVERQAHHSYEVRATEKPDSAWRTEVFKPDAYAHITMPDGERHYFVEVDLGHTSSGEFEKKLAIHARYQTSGLFERRYGTKAFLTLVLTNSERRLLNLKRLAEKEKRTLVRLTTLTAFHRQVPELGLCAPIWQAPFQEGTIRLDGADKGD